MKPRELPEPNENRVEYWVELIINDSLNNEEPPAQFASNCELTIATLQDLINSIKRVDLVSRMDLGDVTVVQA